MTGGRILIFGESENDTKAIKEFIEALCPDAQGKVETRRKPIVLIKDARPENIRPQAEQIASVLAVEVALGPVVCVFAHKDCDGVEPAHEPIARLIEQTISAALARLGVAACAVHAAVPAWEMENWLLLWPSILGAHVSSWRTPSEYRNRNVGMIENGKETLEAALRPRARKGQRAKSRGRVREYKESDAPSIVRAIRDAGVIGQPQGTSASFNRFVASVQSCCEAVA